MIENNRPHDPYIFEVAERVKLIERDVKALRDIKPPQHLVPRYNKLYDTLRTEQAWRYMADGAASGTIATTVNATVDVPVTLINNPNARLSQWPGGLQFYLVLRRFGIALQGAAPAGLAGLTAFFYDQFGYPVALGCFGNNDEFNSSYDDVLPGAITDPWNQTAVGQLAISTPNIATSNSTFQWCMSFSFAYLLPSRHGYDLMPEKAFSHE